jgi:threonine aldolase
MWETVPVHTDTSSYIVRSIRFVLHYQISDSDVQYALTSVEVCTSLRRALPSFIVLVQFVNGIFANARLRFQKAVEEVLKGGFKLEPLANGTTKNHYGH